MSPSGSRMILTTLVLAVVYMSAEMANAQLVDENTRMTICAKAEKLIAEREAIYREILISIGEESKLPTLPMAPAIELQKDIRGLIGANDGPVKTEFATSLPFSIVNLHNNLLALRYFRLNYPNHPNYRDLMNRYAAELEANGALIGKICWDIEPPSGLVQEIETQLLEAQNQAKDNFGLGHNAPAAEKDRTDKCFESCENLWREILDPRHSLEYMIEVAKCKNACLSNSNR